MAITQKQKSIDSLHRSAEKQGFYPILEISSKSKSKIGIQLSAFNLELKIVDDIVTTVESTYQGSKIFKNGGPFTDIYKKNSGEAKKDDRLYHSGDLVGFELNGIKWDLYPDTAFYDWIYINALVQNQELADEMIKFKTFTDIEYNPQKQVSCQSRSAAYFASITKLNLLRDFISSKDDFLQLYKQRPNTAGQYRLQL